MRDRQTRRQTDRQTDRHTLHLYYRYIFIFNFRQNQNKVFFEMSKRDMKNTISNNAVIF